MSALLEGARLPCPYCGQTMEIEVDCSAGDQSYYEDCEVCCMPVWLRLCVDERGDLKSVEGRRDDE